MPEALNVYGKIPKTWGEKEGQPTEKWLSWMPFQPHHSLQGKPETAMMERDWESDFQGKPTVYISLDLVTDLESSKTVIPFLAVSNIRSLHGF